MKKKPRLLDLFCGAGGSAVGYHRAGFEVVGVDILPQPDYPFEFHQSDALTFPTGGFDAIHASPPCQRYSHGTVAGHAHKHPDLVGPTRKRLVSSGLLYVIENVPRSPLINPVVLCGSMFGLTAVDDDGTPLRLQRHRLFEANFDLVAPRACRHDRSVRVAGAYGGARRDKDEAKYIRKGGYVPSVRVMQRLLGIDWMPERSLFLSIPPAYTEHVGGMLMAAISSNIKKGGG